MNGRKLNNINNTITPWDWILLVSSEGGEVVNTCTEQGGGVSSLPGFEVCNFEETSNRIRLQ
jgi:hypothetical protein